MALLNRRPDPALVHIVYFRRDRGPCNALDERLFDLAARYRGRVRLSVNHSSESGDLDGGWVSSSAPTVLFIRDGRTVAQMVGNLPACEIDLLIRAALGRTSEARR
jgi:thioredoxin-like negative regulator of GroEL